MPLAVTAEHLDTGDISEVAMIKFLLIACAMVVAGFITTFVVCCLYMVLDFVLVTFDIAPPKREQLIWGIVAGIIFLAVTIVLSIAGLHLYDKIHGPLTQLNTWLAQQSW